METLKNVYEILEKITKEPRRLEKENIIKENMAAANFKKVVFLALDYTKVFHVSRIDPKTEEKSEKPSIKKLFNMLDRLSSKSGATDKEKEDISKIAWSLDDETAEDLDRILQKDLKCGASLKTFRKIFPEIPHFEVMTCRSDLRIFLNLVEKSKSDVFISDKKDGVRTWGKTYQYISRSGKEYNNFWVFDNELKVLSEYLHSKYGLSKDIYFDGEVTVKNGNFQEVMRNVRTFEDNQENEPEYLYNIFDIVLLDKTQLKLRMAMLEDAFSVHDFENLKLLKHVKVSNGLASAAVFKKHMNSAVKRGEEGIVVKLADSPYELKEKSKYWLKMKPTETYDLLVVGKFGGKGRLKNTLGGLIVKYNDVEVKVGSGYSDEERELFMKNPPSIIEVKCKGETEDGSLREPIFVRVRDDKSTVTDE